jgi:hypothetical protein
MRTHPFAWTWLLLGAFLSACGVDVGGNVQGCEIMDKVGRWFTNDQGSWEYYPTFNSGQRCPIAIFRPGEVVATSGFVQGNIPYTGGTPTERATLITWNSAGEGLAAHPFPFVRRSIDYIETDLYLEYRAATGPARNFSEWDKLRLTISDYCCAIAQHRALIDLRLTYYPDGAARVNVAGNDVPLANTTTTWQASSPNGGRPHQYEWYRNGAWVASGSAYTLTPGASDFQLQVVMTDVYGRTASGTMDVDVDGIRTTIAGPSEVYGGSGQWTASARGGYPPYTYRWYQGGYLVGEGATYANRFAYPDGAQVELEVYVQDSRGAVGPASYSVTAIGGDCGGYAC